MSDRNNRGQRDRGYIYKKLDLLRDIVGPLDETKDAMKGRFEISLEESQLRVTESYMNIKKSNVYKLDSPASFYDAYIILSLVYKLTESENGVIGNRYDFNECDVWENRGKINDRSKKVIKGYFTFNGDTQDSNIRSKYPLKGRVRITLN